MKLLSIFKTTIFLSTTLFFTACGPANTTIITPTPTLVPAELITQWGDEGSYSFYGIAIDKNDNIYTSNNAYTSRIGDGQIRKFDSNGTLLLQWSSKKGSGEEQFYSLLDIAIDSHDNVYMTDDNHRIQKFDSNGTFLLQWGSEGSGEGQFLGCCLGIGVDDQSNIYIADSYNHRIQKFDSNGSFLAKWGEEGNGNGQFLFPKDITIDAFGYIYVTDSGNYRIQKFDSNGVFLLQWGSQLVDGKKDSDNMKFETLRGIHADNRGNIYVADSSRGIIKKFDTNGNFISSWNGSTDGRRFVDPRGIATDSSGNVYVTDADYIWKFKP